MPVTEVEATQIVVRIGPVFQQILNEYDFRKYPAAEYARFKASFSRLNSPNRDIEDAMIWKWGTLGQIRLSAAPAGSGCRDPESLDTVCGF